MSTRSQVVEAFKAEFNRTRFSCGLSLGFLLGTTFTTALVLLAVHWVA